MKHPFVKSNKYLLTSLTLQNYLNDRYEIRYNKVSDMFEFRKKNPGADSDFTAWKVAIFITAKPINFLISYLTRDCFVESCPFRAYFEGFPEFCPFALTLL
ncbi:MAG: hypothetical protein U5K79_24605 [Cyclobacteriaceae bacterium]|nr:hypothetical protein [Cyclobacteriaceae bacterium]